MNLEQTSNLRKWFLDETSKGLGHMVKKHKTHLNEIKERASLNQKQSKQANEGQEITRDKKD